MKTIGMLAGIDWDLTSLYCQKMNALAQYHLGEGHSAKMLINNPDAAELAKLQEEGQWQKVGHLMQNAGRGLIAAGADFLMICGHALHIIAEQLDAAMPVPVLHMGEAVGERLQRDDIHRIGMLNVAFSLEQTFLRQYLTDNFTIELLLSDTGVVFTIHDLVNQGEIGLTPVGQSKLETIFDSFVKKGVEAVLLGDQRISRWLSLASCPLPILDTVSLHAEAAVRRAIG
jgi:aspartate racemase